MWYNFCMEKIQNTTTSNRSMVSISRAEYEKLHKQQSYISELERQNQWLMEQLNLARQKKFGASSEHASPEVLEQMSLLFDEPEAVASVAAEEAAPAVEVRPHKRRKSGSVKDILPDDIEVVEVPHGLSEEERKCPQCGETMACIGKEVRNELKLIPAKAVLYQHVYYTYACENCEKKDISTPVVKTPMEPALVPGGFASAEAVAHVMTQKYVMGVPLYRQEQDWNRQGIMLSRQTMANWLIRCANDWLAPVYGVLHEGLVKHDYLHADETPVQVLREPGRKASADSYMWLYRTGRGAEHPIVLYDYQPGRGGEYPKAFLKGFHGYLQTDGFGSCIYRSIRTTCTAFQSHSAGENEPPCRAPEPGLSAWNCPSAPEPSSSTCWDWKPSPNRLDHYFQSAIQLVAHFLIRLLKQLQVVLGFLQLFPQGPDQLYCIIVHVNELFHGVALLQRDHVVMFHHSTPPFAALLRP